MIVPINSNSIYIPLVPTGCLKSKFDSTYPIQLNGIIRQDEFQQSINNINHTISSRKSLIICGLIFLLCVIGGITLFVVGGINAVNSRTYSFPLLVDIGFGVFGLGILFLIFGCCMIQSRRTTPMQQAISNESMKYSARSPIPCSWRLDIIRNSVRVCGYRRTVVVYRLVIEIGNPIAAISGNVPYQANQMTYQSTPYFPQQSSAPPLPSYYGQPTPGFCSQCGMPRQNPMAAFCSSCGQPFNK